MKPHVYKYRATWRVVTASDTVAAPSWRAALHYALVIAYRTWAQRVS